MALSGQHKHKLEEATSKKPGAVTKCLAQIGAAEHHYFTCETALKLI